MPNVSLGTLKGAISRISYEVSTNSPDGLARNAEVLRRVREDCSAQLDDLRDWFVDRALIKLLNQVAARNLGGRSAGLNHDFFERLIGVPPMLSVGNEAKKPTLQMTIQELDDRAKAREVRYARKSERRLREFVDNCRESGARDSETVEAFFRRTPSVQ